MMRAPASGFLRAVLLAQRHQAGHFLLGEPDLLAPEFGERQVFHLERLAAGGLGGGEGMKCWGGGSHVLFSFLNVRGAPPPRAVPSPLSRLGFGCIDLLLSAAFSQCQRTVPGLLISDPASSGTILIVGESALRRGFAGCAHLKTRARRDPSAGGSSRDRAAACRRSAPAARLEHARRLRCSARSGSGRWCSTSASVAASSRASSIGSASSSPRRSSTLSNPCSRFFAACSIAADASTAMTRLTNGASAAVICPVPQPRSPTVHSASANAGSAARWKRSPNSSSRSAIPLPGGGREELLRFGAPLGQHRLDAALILQRPQASGRPARERAPRAAARTDRARRASSRTGCSCLRRAPRSSRCRRAPSGAG